MRGGTSLAPMQAQWQNKETYELKRFFTDKMVFLILSVYYALSYIVLMLEIYVNYRETVHIIV